MWANPMTQQPCRCRRRSFDVMTCAKSELPEPYVHIHSVNTHSPPVLSGVFFPGLESKCPAVGKSSRHLARHGQHNWPTVTGYGSRSLPAYRCTAPYMGKTRIRNADSTAEVSGWFQNNHLTWSQLKNFQKNKVKPATLQKHKLQPWFSKSRPDPR